MQPHGKPRWLRFVNGTALGSWQLALFVGTVCGHCLWALTQTRFGCEQRVVPQQMEWVAVTKLPDDRIPSRLHAACDGSVCLATDQGRTVVLAPQASSLSSSSSLKRTPRPDPAPAVVS